MVWVYKMRSSIRFNGPCMCRVPRYFPPADASPMFRCRFKVKKISKTKKREGRRVIGPHPAENAVSTSDNIDLDFLFSTVGLASASDPLIGVFGRLNNWTLSNPAWFLLVFSHLSALIAPLPFLVVDHDGAIIPRCDGYRIRFSWCLVLFSLTFWVLCEMKASLIIVKTR